MKRIFWTVMPLLLMAGCMREPVIVERDRTPENPDMGYARKVFEVKFTEEMTEAIEIAAAGGMPAVKSVASDNILQDYGVVSMRRIFPDAGEFEERTRREGLHRWYYVELDGSMPATKAAKSFAGLPGVEQSNPLPLIQKMGFNDPLQNYMWGLFSDVGNGVNINVEDVWENYTTGDPSVIVAVVDEAVYITHEDLAANCIPAGSSGSWNYIKDSPALSYTDGSGHGSHVAGTIAAVNNNGKGVCGIAGGDAAKGQGGVKILSCQILGDSGATEATNANAIKSAADKGALVCQNSWGYVLDRDKDGHISDEEKEIMKGICENISRYSIAAAIDYFIKYAGCDNNGDQLPGSKMKGGLVTFAAGNDNFNYGAPAYYDKVIAVGAIDNNGARASFSNYGDWVDICAPGVDIASCGDNNKYIYMSGTSMACPHVSGVAALVLSYRGGYGFTNELLKDCLLNSASYENISALNIGPLVDALGAVLYGIVSPPQAVSSFTVEANSNNISFSWAVPDSGDGTAAYGAMLCVSENRSSIENIDMQNLTSDVKTVLVKTSDKQVGQTASGTVTNLKFNKDYYATVVACNYPAAYAAAAPVGSTHTGQNNAPVITPETSTDNLVLHSSETFLAKFNIVDPDGHSLTVRYTSGSAADSWSPVNGGGYQFMIAGAKVAAGTYQAKITATDSYGLFTDYQIDYEVLENTAPVVSGSIANVVVKKLLTTKTVSLDGVFFDGDGDRLSYSVTNSASSVAHVVASGGSLNITALKYGRADIVVTASDPRGERASTGFTVVVKESSESSVSTYPNPVSTVLNVSSDDDPDEMKISLYSPGGALLVEKTATVGGSSVATIDMKGFAPGVYTLVTECAGKKDVRKVVKI